MADLVAMVQPFADEELKTFAGRGGKEFTYIEDETVMDRLDLGFGRGNWTVHVEPIPVFESVVEGVVKVRLGVRPTEDGEWVWYEDFGYTSNKGEDAQQLKEAVSDGIRRCGRYLGIARDLYRKDSGTPPRPQSGHIMTASPASFVGDTSSSQVINNYLHTTTPIRSSTAVPEPPLDWDVLDKSKPEPFEAKVALARDVDGTMTTKELLDRADSGQVPVDALAQASKKLYGPKAWQIKALTDIQRYTVAVEVGLA